jgi:opacity protein-like surface antigen
LGKEETMGSWRVVAVAIFILTVGAFNAGAQSYSTASRDIEVTPFGGTRFGGSINFSPPAEFTTSSGTSEVDSIPIKSSFDYGLWFDYGIWPGFQAEFLWNRQPTELRAYDASTNSTSDIGSAKLDMYNWGALWELKGEESKLKPYIAMGVGFTHFNTYGALTNFGNKLSYNIGGGVKYEFNQHFGLRADVRYSPTRTTSQEEEFETYFGPVEENVHNHANQGQANIGVIFKF